MTRISAFCVFVFAALTLAACGGRSVTPSSGSQSTLPESTAIWAAATVPPYSFVDLGAGPNGGSAIAQGGDKTNQGGSYVYGTDSCGKVCSFKVYHALAWSGAASTPVDITPPLINFAEAWVYGGSGTMLVGMGVTNNGGYFGSPHALIWRGSTFAWKDINPPGDTNSYAYGTNGAYIAGSGSSSSLHALLWSTSNLTNPIDLHPGSAYTSSEAFGTYGSIKQVGYAVTSSSTPTQHAMLWSGTAASAVDLTPSGVTSAYAYATTGTYQVGCGIPSTTTASHALLWQGSAASMKDLNPAGFTDSCARAIRSGIEAGYGHVSGALHAVVWMGTAKSAVDLQASLPTTYTQSEAFGFDSLGDIIGAVYSATGWHGAMWVP